MGSSNFNRLLATPWTVVCQAPLAMDFSRQEYWSLSHSFLQGNLPNPGVHPLSPALQGDSLPSEPAEKLPNTVRLSANVQVRKKRKGKMCTQTNFHRQYNIAYNTGFIVWIPKQLFCRSTKMRLLICNLKFLEKALGWKVTQSHYEPVHNPQNVNCIPPFRGGRNKGSFRGCLPKSEN